MTGHQGTTRLVAVKTVKEGASEREKEDLVRELEIMQKVGSHPNVVTLLGCCTEQGKSVFFIIIVYALIRSIDFDTMDKQYRSFFFLFPFVISFRAIIENERYFFCEFECFVLLRLTWERFFGVDCKKYRYKDDRGQMFKLRFRDESMFYALKVNFRIIMRIQYQPHEYS